MQEKLGNIFFCNIQNYLLPTSLYMNSFEYSSKNCTVRASSTNRVYAFLISGTATSLPFRRRQIRFAIEINWKKWIKLFHLYVIGILYSKIVLIYCKKKTVIRTKKWYFVSKIVLTNIKKKSFEISRTIYSNSEGQYIFWNRMLLKLLPGSFLDLIHM